VTDPPTRSMVSRSSVTSRTGAAAAFVAVIRSASAANHSASAMAPAIGPAPTSRTSAGSISSSARAKTSASRAAHPRLLPSTAVASGSMLPLMRSSVRFTNRRNISSASG
jgi:hypothetical protein